MLRRTFLVTTCIAYTSEAIGAGGTQISPRSNEFILQSSSLLPTPRRGPVLTYVSNSFFLFGGKHGNSCLADAWTSTGNDDPWIKVDATAQPRPSGALDAPVAVDASGCLWLLGGDCNDRVDGFWKTCDVGVTWMPISRPIVVPSGMTLPVFPAAFSGHAIAILGDWQIVIVDAASSSNGGVWRFIDREAKYVQKVASAPLAFGQRRNPSLLATSSGALYLLGGDLCDDSTCTNSVAFNDLWKSLDVGSSWACQAARYTPHTNFESPVLHIATTITHDDTMFLAGGLVANSTTPLNTVLYSRSGDADTVFQSSPNMWVKSGATSFRLCFLEAVQLGQASIKMWDYGSDHAPGGNASAADTSVSDLAGNALLTAIEYSFYPDNLGPIVQYANPAGANIAPWSNILLTMNEVVSVGSGSLRLLPEVGSEVSLDVSNSLINDKSVFLELPAGTFFTEGQKYTIVAPHGLLQDTHGNSMNAGVVGTFRVFSGYYTANDYKGSLVTIANVAPTSTGNSGVPALVSTYPPSGATDIPVDFGIYILLFFSAPVKLDSQGTIKFQRAGNEVSKSVTDAATTITSHNVVKVSVPLFEDTMAFPLLTRGGLVKVEISSGAIRSLSNVPVGKQAIALNFTCLAGQIDTVPPVVEISEAMYYNTSAMSAKFDIYFSEAIQAAAGGNLSLTTSTSQQILKFNVSSSTVSINGSKLSLTVPEGNMILNGLYTLTIPAGCVRDLQRTFPGRKGPQGGGNLLKEEYNVVLSVAVDREGPLLQIPTTRPLLKADPAAAHTLLPPSHGLMLYFNEAIQAGPGHVVLTPEYTSFDKSSTVRIPTSSAFISQGRAFLTPPVSLVPGERYQVGIEPGSFTDVHSNPFVGLPQDYYLWTAPIVVFEQLGSSQFGATGERYSSGIAVDGNNTIYLVGGVDSSGDALNDMWNLETGLPTNCASAWQPRGSCSSASCSYSGNQNILGSAQVKKQVWRASENGGLNCDTSATPNQVGDTVGSRQDQCPCPLCVTPPVNPLPANMNSGSLASYSFIEAGSTHSLQCQSGYNATGHFSCVVSDDLFGKFQRPYPSCQPLNCDSPPNTSVVSFFSQFHIEASTSDVNCSVLNDHTHMQHGGACAIKCAPGWTASHPFKCEFGAFQSGACARQNCSPVSVPNGKFQCGASHSGVPVATTLGDTCNLTCNAGFQMPGQTTQFSCRTETNALAEASPSIIPTPVCEPSPCGDFPVAYLQNASVVYATIQYGSSKVMGDVAIANCTQGYSPAALTGLVLRCGIVTSQPGHSQVEWQSNLTGQTAGPPCVEDGYETTMQYVVTGTLEVDFDPPVSVTMEDLCNASFYNSTALSLADSYRYIGADVPDGNVSNVVLSHCNSSRRLSPSVHGRRMAATRIDYRVLTADGSASRTIQAALAYPPALPAFAYRFHAKLLELTGVASQKMLVVVNRAEAIFSKVQLPTATPTTTIVPAGAPATDDGSSVGLKVLFAILVGVLVTSIFLGTLYLRVKRLLAEDAERNAKAEEDAQREADIRAYRENDKKAKEFKKKQSAERKDRSKNPNPLNSERLLDED